MNCIRNSASAILALLCLQLIGCDYGKVLCPPPASQEAWTKVVKQWTRSNRIYDRFKTELMAWATYRSEKFRRGYVVRYAAAYGLTPAEQAKMLADQLAAHRRDIVFLFAAFTPDRVNNDFNRKKSMWRLWLEDEFGRRLEPYEVRRIRKVSDKLYRFYPHLTPYMNVYVVRFRRKDPRTKRPFLRAGAKQMSFWISGLPGRLRLPFGP